MNKLLSTSLKLLGVAMLAVAIWVGYIVYSFGQPVKAFDITSGNAGSFVIGETKESLLARLPEQVYSPEPKPAACPANWIEVKVMSPTQKQCLLSTNQWESSGIKELCPENTDFFATLFFSGSKLVKVGIRCTHPE